MVGEVLLPVPAVPEFDMVPDTDQRDVVFQSSSFAEPFIEQESALGVQLDSAGQGEAQSFERHGLIRGGGLGCNGKGYALKVFFGIKTKYAVGTEHNIEIVAVFFRVNLAAELVRNEDPAFAVEYVLVFAC